MAVESGFTAATDAYELDEGGVEDGGSGGGACDDDDEEEKSG